MVVGGVVPYTNRKSLFSAFRNAIVGLWRCRWVRVVKLLPSRVLVQIGVFVPEELKIPNQSVPDEANGSLVNLCRSSAQLSSQLASSYLPAEAAA